MNKDYILMAPLWGYIAIAGALICVGYFLAWFVYR